MLHHVTEAHRILGRSLALAERLALAAADLDCDAETAQALELALNELRHGVRLMLWSPDLSVIRVSVNNISAKAVYSLKRIKGYLTEAKRLLDGYVPAELIVQSHELLWQGYERASFAVRRLEGAMARVGLESVPRGVVSQQVALPGVGA